MKRFLIEVKSTAEGKVLRTFHVECGSQADAEVYFKNILADVVKKDKNITGEYQHTITETKKKTL